MSAATASTSPTSADGTTLPAGRAAHRRVLQLALPAALATLAVPMVGLVDLAIVGRWGEATLTAGLAAAITVLGALLATLNFLRFTTVALVAQACGARAPATEAAVVLRALLLALGLGAVLALAAPWLGPAGLQLLGVEGETAEAGLAYLDVRLRGMPLLLLGFVLSGWLLGQGRAGAVLALQVVLNAVNVAGSVALAYGLDWGMRGIALAAVLADLACVLLGLLWLWRWWPRDSGQARWQALRDASAWGDVLRLNRDILVRSLALFAVMAWFTRQSALQGPVVLAANAVLLQCFYLASAGLDGVAAAAEHLAGKAVGARDRSSFVRVVRLTRGWGYAFALVLSLLFAGGGTLVIALLSASEEVRVLAREFLPWAVLLPWVGMAAFQLDGVYVGASATAAMRNWMLASVTVYGVVSWLAIPGWGNHGLWLAFCLFLAARGVGLQCWLPRLVARRFPSA